MICYIMFSLGMTLPAWAVDSEEPDTGPEPTVQAAPQVQIEPNELRWATASEKDNFGYEVYRGLSKNGPYKKINLDIIEGAGTTDIPQRYHFTDSNIEPGTVYWYYIESISLTGDRRRVTPKYAAEAKEAIPSAE